jgi:hypothetical protein
LTAIGGAVAYDYQLDGSGHWKKNEGSVAPAWWQKLFGEEYFRHAAIVNLDVKSDPTDDDLETIEWLPDLYQLTLDGRTKLTDSCLKHLSHCKHLQWLTISHTHITGSGGVSLESLKNLEGFAAQDSAFNDEGLSHLKSATNLRWVFLTNTKITDQGMIYLSGLRSLEILEMDGTAVTDEGLVHLYELKTLKRINLPDRITTKARESLQKALPNCKL